MRNKQNLLKAIFVILLTYMSLAFISVQGNPLLWHFETRVVFVSISFAMSYFFLV